MTTGESSAFDKSARYCSPKILYLHRAGEDTTLMYSPLTDTTRLLSNEQAVILEWCTKPFTLQEHARRIDSAAQACGIDRASIPQRLQQLADFGALLPEAFYQQRCMQYTGVDSAANQIVSVGIPTRNRPESLERCLRSYAQCARHYGRKLRFIVADQSLDLATQESNQELLGRLSAELDFSAGYIGSNEKRELVSLLAKRSGLSQEVISFALINIENCPSDTGLNRNALLLSSAGELTMQVDDDSICSISPLPEFSPGLNISSTYSALEMWFPSAQEMIKIRSDSQDGWGEQDFFALHEQLLGKNIGTCISQNAGLPLNLEDASPTFFQRAKPGRGKVLVTSLGIIGNSGIGTPHHFLRLSGEMRQRLISSESHYRYVMQEQNLIRGPGQTSINDSAFCSGFNLGLDNRQLLPFFMPVQRHQDCVFGALLRSCCKDAYSGFLPWALKHDRPARHRMGRENERRFLCNRLAGQLIEILLTELAAGADAGDMSQNMLALGRAIEQLGRGRLAEFEAVFRTVIFTALSDHKSGLEFVLQKFAGEPVYWAEDVKEQISWLEEAMLDDNLVVAWDLSAAFGVETARLLMQRLALRFGRLLQIWPELWESARQLRESGFEPGRRVGR